MNEKDKNVHNLCISCGQLFLEIFFFILSKDHLCEVKIFLFHEKHTPLVQETVQHIMKQDNLE